MVHLEKRCRHLFTRRNYVQMFWEFPSTDTGWIKTYPLNIESKKTLVIPMKKHGSFWKTLSSLIYKTKWCSNVLSRPKIDLVNVQRKDFSQIEEKISKPVVGPIRQSAMAWKIFSPTHQPFPVVKRPRARLSSSASPLLTCGFGLISNLDSLREQSVSSSRTREPV